MYLFEPKEYLITISIVTRKQVNELRRCINSLIDNSDKSVNNFEIIVKVDYDDYETIDFIREFNNENINISFIISSRQNGYPSLHEFFNDMFGMARGKYVAILSSDSPILTPNWNTLLIDHLTEFKFYFVNYHVKDKLGNITKLENLSCNIDLKGREWVNVGKHYFDFLIPIVPKKIKDLWGTISPHALVDNWLGEMAKRVSYNPWNEDCYSFIEDIIIETTPPTDELTPETNKVYNTYQYYVNDAIFFDCANKLSEYKQSEKYNYYRKLNTINDFRNSGKDVVEYFNLK
jgi:glycosyltransferase involved in cell wall biosynthesis